MQTSLASGQYDFTIFDSVKIAFHDAEASVTNDSAGFGNSFGIDLDIMVNINLLPKKPTYLTAESNLKQFKDGLERLRMMTFNILEDDIEIFLQPGSPIKSAAYAIQYTEDTALYIADQLNNLPEIRNEAGSANVKFQHAMFSLSSRLRNFIDNKLGMDEVRSTFVKAPDGTVFEVEVTWRASSNGPKAVIKITKLAYFANGTRLPFSPGTLEAVGQITAEMVDIGAMISLMGSLQINMGGAPGVFLPSFGTTAGTLGCVRIIDYITGPDGNEIPYVAKDCP